ncbi:MAG: hypothetical protein JST89_25815 [Cyanobacteria bacterium SZAS-4]|nr:hypothetical protein [Cyanobacteria bacterium SZAS-4]
MNAKSVAFFCVTAWTLLSSTVALADTTADVIDSGPLKKNGAKQLNVLFEDSTDDKPQHAWLQGVSNENVVWKKSLPLKFPVNTAKTDVICRKGRIEVVSQYPGSAAYTNQTFTWDGEKVTFVSKKDGDPSQEQVDKLMKLAVSGTHQQLSDFANDEHVIFYPGNYINTDNVKAMLTAGRKKALALASAHKAQQAAQRMEICLDASMELCYLEGEEGETKTAPAKWIEAWSEDRIALPSTFWKPILKDYSTLLKASGKLKQASAIANAAKDDSSKKRN